MTTKNRNSCCCSILFLCFVMSKLRFPQKKFIFGRHNRKRMGKGFSLYFVLYLIWWIFYVHVFIFVIRLQNIWQNNRTPNFISFGFMQVTESLNLKHKNCCSSSFYRLTFVLLLDQHICLCLNWIIRCMPLSCRLNNIGLVGTNPPEDFSSHIHILVYLNGKFSELTYCWFVSSE